MSEQTLTYEPLQNYVLAAWHFANAVLWPESSYNEPQVMKEMSGLAYQFSTVADPAEAYLAFCEKVAIVDIYRARFALNKIKILPFLLNGKVGIDGLPVSSQKIRSLKGKIKSFAEVMQIISKHYLAYIKSPGVNIFLTCAQELEAIDAKWWLALFHVAVQNQPIQDQQSN